MFCCYIALYEISKELYFTACTISRKYSSSFEKNFKDLILKYRCIQLYSKRINICFQEKYALWFQPILMFTCIVPATILINPKLRATTSFAGIMLSVYTVVNAYIFLVVGYFFPGKVNDMSRQNLKRFNSLLEKVSGIHSVRLCKRIIRTCQDNRVYIGYANFYEQSTALNILNFQIIQTINITLII